MLPILAFDLDDTLYPERTYVVGGLRAVARFLARDCGVDATDACRTLTEILDREGRGQVFDTYLRSVSRHSRGRVAACLRVYRAHEPEIALYPAARRLLDRLEGRPLYLITDGNKLVQRRKVEALGLDGRFRKIFITHRHGIRHAKPSTHCFDRLREIERIEPCDLVYVGDNPAKDFVGLNRQGGTTVRVRTGMHADVPARPGHDARITIADLDEFSALLHELRAAHRQSPPRLVPHRKERS